MAFKDLYRIPAPKGATHYTNDVTASYKWLKKEGEDLYFYHEEHYKWNKYPENSWVADDHLRNSEEVDSLGLPKRLPSADTVITNSPFTLIIFNKDWADEFDCESFELFKGSVEEATNHIDKQFFSERDTEDDDNEDAYQGISFGTNEGWENDELEKRDFTFKSITETEAEVISRLLGKTFGVGYKPSKHYDKQN